MARFDPDGAWSNSGDGFILSSAAKRLGVEYLPELAVFSGFSDPTAARALVKSAGFNEQLLGFRREYTPIPMAKAASLARFGLLAMFGVVVYLVTGSQVRGLRRDTWLLYAVGVPSTKARSVLLWQMGTLFILGVSLGLMTAIAGVGLVVSHSDGVDLALPWAEFGGTALLAGGICVLATEVSSRRLLRESSSSQWD